MQVNETTPILRPLQNGLSVFFAIICIVDVFGVFPVIALPKPVIDCGYYGIAVILVVCTVQIYTACLLGKCWNLVETINPNIKRKNRYPYSALAETAFGRVASYLVTFLVDVTVFGGAIPNLIVGKFNWSEFHSVLRNSKFQPLKTCNSLDLESAKTSLMYHFATGL